MGIVSEFMALGCMLDFLRSRGRGVITGAVQLGFVKNIAEAMMYLEGEGYVHRDLAARNILLSADQIAKVADFGWARTVPEDEPEGGCRKGRKGFPDGKTRVVP